MIHSSSRAHQRRHGGGQTNTGSKLIKNGEVNSAHSEEMEFSQISRGFASKALPMNE